MTSSSSPDVIVVGAGIAGVSVAAMLASHCTVVLLEREQHPGYHATGRSAAFFAPAYGNQAVRDVTGASETFFRTPPDNFCDVPLIRPRDALFVATEEQEAALNNLTEENPGLEVLRGNQLKDKVPVLNVEKLTLAANDSTGGDLDVDAIMQGFLRQFRDAGGVLKTSTTVNNITNRSGTWRVNTSSDEYQAPLLVNAAGAWADQLAELAHLGGLGLSPMRRTAMLVDPPPGIDISNWPLVVDASEHFYFKPDAGQLLLSPADETPSDPCDAHPREIDIALAVDRIQQVADLPVTRINHSWAGLRTFAPDRTFVAGFDPRATGFFWLAGQGGYGVQTCPGLADIACYLITGSHSILQRADIKKHIDTIKPDRLLS